MTETVIDGQLFVRWLRSDGMDPTLLSGCDFDDGERDDLLAITGADAQRQVLACLGNGRPERIPFGRVAHGVVIAPPDHPLIAAVEAGVSPQERADRQAKADLGPEFAIQFASSADLNTVHAAVTAFRANQLPDPSQRYRQAEALKRNGLYSQGARIAERWRDLVRSKPEPWADIALDLAWFLRAHQQPARAIAVLEDFRRAKVPGTTPHLRAMLATVEAGAWIDKFERKGGEKPDLAAAWNAIGRAWAIEAERDHPEVTRVYARLRAIGSDPR